MHGGFKTKMTDSKRVVIDLGALFQWNRMGLSFLRDRLDWTKMSSCGTISFLLKHGKAADLHFECVWVSALYLYDESF